MTSPQEAKKLYEQLLATRDLSHGLRFTRDDSRLHDIEGWNWDWIHHGATLTKEGIEIFASPWHACVYLYKQMALHANNDLDASFRAKATEEIGIPLPIIGWLFRGQRNPEWHIQTSMQRLEGIERIAAMSSSLRFSALLRKTISECGFPFIDDQVLMAAAQHYGIATNLLDFSIDPAVAVFFANEQPNDPNTGAVFGMHTPKALYRFGFKLVLPPPFVERIYIQRGVFLQDSDDQPQTFKSECHEIRFIKDPEFEVIRAGKIEPNILKADPFLETLTETSQKWASAGNRWQEIPQSARVQILNRDFENLRQHLPENYSKAIAQDEIALWVEGAVNLIEALGCGQLDGKLYFTQNITDSVAENNPILSTLISSYLFGQFAAFHTRPDLHEAEAAHSYEMAREICTSLSRVYNTAATFAKK